jgi:predicted GNAT superfamily acetyltransferase
MKAAVLRSFPMPTTMGTITIRDLSTNDEYDACVRLQRETWGKDFDDVIPASLLKVSQKVGGVTAGAFDESGRMVGFVFGLTGMHDGVPAHWSHMLAVSNDVRGRGVGKALKLYQRSRLLEQGVRVAYWTFDPLVARNANLNLNGLGAEITEYVKDMYLDTGSDLHRGLGMDRFIVVWHLDNERVRAVLAGTVRSHGERFAQAPVVNTRVENGGIIPEDQDLPMAQAVRVEIPAAIEEVQKRSLDLAARWRANTRRAFLSYQEAGYRVAAFYHDAGRCFYCLTKS